jgi:UDP-glucose 4-epimerase
MKVIVTGGAGYIGSTICSSLLDAGHTPIIWDSLVTGNAAFTKDRIFYRGDIASAATLEQICTDHPDAETVIHCAARIIVPESTAEPALYYRENVTKSLELFDNLRHRGITKIVFSSSASVYAESSTFTVNEEHARAPQSPYARTKAMMEDLLIDFAKAYSFQSIILRYFNPIGADTAFRSGPFVPNPTHLLGRLVAASHGGEPFNITGTDWPTRDGTGLRDYIHVQDLADAHIAAVERFQTILDARQQPWTIINLGTGSGTTVREFVTAFEKVLGRSLGVSSVGPRPGDNAGCCTITDRAQSLLKWQPKLSLVEGIQSALQWAEKQTKE